MSNYDLTIIGSGPGGYVCAIRAAQLGMKVAVVEKRDTHGGTCLNVGCIPSKALLHASEMFEEAGKHFSSLGIKIDDPQLDLPMMMNHKQETIDANVTGIDFLFKKNKIDSYNGIGKIVSSGKVSVTNHEGKIQELETSNIVIATGSDSVNLPSITPDEKRIVTSTGALTLEQVPKKMIVVGAGVIGLELGSVWRRLGSEVTIIEFLDRILPGMDNDIAKQFQRMLKKQGMAFKLGTKVISADYEGNSIQVTLQPAAGGKNEVIETDVMLVAIGRSPYTEGLGLEALDIALDDRKRIITDEHFKTSVDGIYAIGDVIAGPMLAHKAEDEGVALAEILAGQAGHVNYNTIPGVVYTMPEIASVGKTEEELKMGDIAYNIGKFPFSANGRAKAMNKSEGFVKILACKSTDVILGVHIIGAGAGEMIHEAVILMEFGASAEDLARICHAHPTMSEALKEAALAVDKRPIHM